ncbi:MAG: LptF/LptG family permease [Verrucomicrobia bacterium]|nr:LptF/LptG family permease [Verrucomicrobiota bacterium]
MHDRYFFRELITPLAYILGGFLVFWVTIFFFTKLDDIREAKLGALDSLEFCVAGLPEFFLLVLPMLLLLGMLYALTHHARHNEITALRSAGISLWRLCAPYFVIGLVATGVYFAVNEIAVPACQQWTTEILTRHVKQDRDPRIRTHFSSLGFRNVRAQRIWNILGGYDTVTATMSKVDVRWMPSEGPQRLLMAESAVYTNKAWVFFNVQQFELHEKWVQLQSTNQLAMPEFNETPRQFKLEARYSEANGLLSSRSADIPIVDLWPYIRQNPDRKDINRALTKLHGRIAAPWTCFIVVLMAIPFGAQSGRRNLFFGVAGSIFICFAFFVLQQVSLAFGMGGQLPGWIAAWLPNLVFAGVGTFLTLRVR